MRKVEKIYVLLTYVRACVYLDVLCAAPAVSLKFTMSPASKYDLKI